MSRLVAAFARGRAQKTFECPHTGLTLILRAPTYRERLAAENHAAILWRDRTVHSALDLGERANLVRVLLIGFCMHEEGTSEPIGEEILGLGESALASYSAVLQSIESPALEEWTHEDFDGLVDLLKKKDPQIAALLKISEGSMLYGLLLYMADHLSNSPMANSSTNS